MKRVFPTLVLASFGLAWSITPATSQDTEAEIAELKDRIARLETQAAETPKLSFGIVPSEDTRLLELAEQIGNQHGLGRLSFSAGGSTTISIYGFVRLEGFYDFDTAQGDLTRIGRVGEPAFATDGEFETSVRVSRFGIRSATETDFGQIGTQLEFDLFSGNDTTTSPTVRLRHANIRIGDAWILGQFWSNFMPLTHYPRSADFNGPVGIAFARVPQLRYTHAAGDLQLSASIEEAAGGSSDPVFTAAALYETDRYSLRLAGLTGSFESGGSEFDTNAVTLSGSISPWQGGTFAATYTDGAGIGNLLVGGGDQAVAGIVNDSQSYTLEFRQDLSEKLSVGVAYGNADFDLPTNTGTIDFTELESVHVNAFYSPVENLTIALEYIHLERTSSAGVSSDADRIGASVTFRF